MSAKPQPLPSNIWNVNLRTTKIILNVCRRMRKYIERSDKMSHYALLAGVYTYNQFYTRTRSLSMELKMSSCPRTMAPPTWCCGERSPRWPHSRWRCWLCSRPPRPLGGGIILPTSRRNWLVKEFQLGVLLAKWAFIFPEGSTRDKTSNPLM